ncbi:MAG: hypothetical protein LAP85_20020 [Acidobacteriia bacterium]|nr:hypothetical protein [Terriglobia bacterium]
MILFRICLATIVVGFGVQQNAGSGMPEKISYRLLDSSRRQFGDLSAVDYALSVDRFLDRPQIEELICQVLRDQKPAPSSALGISIFYNLDKAFVTGGLPNIEQRRLDHAIADYFWNKSLPDKRNRLLIWRDARGNLVKKFYDFDHTDACKKQQ